MLIYALALGLGLAQAFGMPSGTSIMPQSTGRTSAGSQRR
jgi:hypothetical protein